MKKICLIGGSGVLGKYFVKQLCKKNELHVADIGLKNVKKSKKLFTYYLDISNEKSVNHFFKKNKQKPFDILINNSAFTTEMALAKKTSKDIFSSEIFEKTIDVNLKGVFLCCKNFINYHHKKNIDQIIFLFRKVSFHKIIDYSLRTTRIDIYLKIVLKCLL